MTVASTDCHGARDEKESMDRTFQFFLWGMFYAVVASAENVSVEGISWDFLRRGQSAEITTGHYQIEAIPIQTSGEVRVPSFLAGLPVRKLGDYAFAHCQGVTAVHLPASATERYGVSVFQGCTALRRISLPEGMTELGTALFQGCARLESVRLPDSLKKITQLDFQGCVALRQIALPDSVVSILDGAFSDCTALEEVALPRALVRLGNSAFRGSTSLRSVIFQSGLKRLDDYAFAACSALRHVTFHGPVPATQDSDPARSSWKKIFDGVPVRSLVISYPAAHAAAWNAVVSQIGCQGKVIEDGAEVIPEDPDVVLTPEELALIRTMVERELGTLTETVRVRGTAGDIRASLALGLLPRIESSGLVVYERPTLLITRFDPATGAVEVQAVPGHGGRADPDYPIRRGTLHFYGAETPAGVRAPTALRLKVTQEETLGAGAARLKLTLPSGKSYFLRGRVSP